MRANYKNRGDRWGISRTPYLRTQEGSYFAIMNAATLTYGQTTVQLSPAQVANVREAVAFALRHTPVASVHRNELSQALSELSLIEEKAGQNSDEVTWPLLGEFYD